MSDGQVVINLDCSKNYSLLKKQIESLLFMAKEPININDFCKILKSEKKNIENNLQELILEYEQRGIKILIKSNGYIMTTDPQCLPVLEVFLQQTQKINLSNSSLEVLAIIAYKQPITRKGIEMIRGVNSDQIVNNLLDKELIAETKPSNEIGRSMLLETTSSFLNVFGLQNIKELPPIESNSNQIAFKN